MASPHSELAGGPRRVLITGGAGFIGSHLADELLARGHAVAALDNLCEQVHGPGHRRPEYLDPRVDLLVGDVRDADAVRTALRGVDAVVHLAAAVGVGQSMYEIAHYTAVNNLGTAVLLEALAAAPVKSLVVASSMSVYGEGLYHTADGEPARATERSTDALKARRWEPADPDGRPLVPLPTPETKSPSLASVYALGKFDQERMGLLVGRAYGVPTAALRFFNVYGPRQSLGNPYTGVLAIFASRLLNDAPPLIYEDGLQRRDFVSVHDVARAIRLTLDNLQTGGSGGGSADGGVFNVASGEPRTVLEVAERLAAVLGKREVKPQVTGKCRVGDIRHCFADISLARRTLDYEPRVRFDEGLAELAGWLRDQSATDRVEHARRELDARGLAL